MRFGKHSGGRRRAAARRPRRAAADLRGVQRLETRIAFAVTPSLVADINTLPKSSLAAATSTTSSFAFGGPAATATTPEFVTFNGKTFFAADDGVHGTELWVSDGTASGTSLFKDIKLLNADDGSAGSSGPADFFIAGSTLYFSADDGVHGRELWKTDGTAAGTVLVKDINAGSSYPHDFAQLTDGTVLFIATSMKVDSMYPNPFKSIWKTDGSEAGTVSLDPTNTFGAMSISGLTSVGSQAVFAASWTGLGDMTRSTRLCVTDGMLANTRILMARSSSEVVSPMFFTTVQETFTPVPGYGSSSTETIAFFVADGGLWRTNGTENGTFNVSDVQPINFDDPRRPVFMPFGTFSRSDLVNSIPGTVSGSRVVFAGDDGSAGIELWGTDGTTTGTTQLANINTTSTLDSTTNSNPYGFLVAGSNLFFSADDGVNGRELWKYDGTTAALLSSIRPGVAKTPLLAGQIFPTTQTSTLGATWAYDAATADFDRDGKVDLVVLDAPHTGAASNDSLRVMRGGGDGTFVPGVTLPLTGVLISPSSIATADVNNDGFMDVIAARSSVVIASTFSDNGYSVFLGNGDGTFQPERTLVGEGSDDLTLADFDRDGKIDIIAFGVFEGWRRGNGDGTFLPPQPICPVDLGSGSKVSAVADIDADGALDVIVTNPTDQQVVVLRNRGDGTFEPERFFSAGNVTFGVLRTMVGDVNGDGKPDIVTVGSAAEGVYDRFSVLLGTGGGMFAAPKTATLPTGVGINDTALVDVDGDSVLDLVMSVVDSSPGGTNPSATGVGVLIGNGDGTFLPVSMTGPQTGSGWVSVADFNGDGRPDVAVANGADIAALLNSGETGVAPAASDPIPLAASGSTLYFAADDGTHGLELWKTDGTTTSLVKDINTGSPGGFNDQSSSSYISAALLGGELLFAADDGQHGVELWKSDGTTSGTGLVEDISPETSDGIGANDYQDAVVLNSTLFFAADDGVHGKELWKRVGNAPPEMIADLTNGSGSSQPRQFVVSGNRVYFTTVKYTNNPASSFTYPVFSLWTTDSSAAGTVLLADDVLSSVQPPQLNCSTRYLAPFGDRLLFSANDSTHGRELWITDGTKAGTVLLKDIFVDTAFSGVGNGDSSPSWFTAVGQYVYFTATEYGSGRQIWRTDGTVGGTEKLTSFPDRTTSPYGDEFPRALTAFGDGVIYKAIGDSTFDVELWTTTSLGTTLVKDINPTESSFPDFFAELGGKFFFNANDGVHGYELWVTDGTAGNTQLVKDINPGAESSEPALYTGGFYRFGDRLYFTASDGVTTTLWQTDGTASGTVQAIVPVGFSANQPQNLVVANGLAYFTAQSGQANVLIQSDGTVSGTKVIDLLPGVSGNRAAALVATADRLYFTADDGVHGLELWQYLFDTVPPTVAITVESSSLGAGQTALVTLTLSETPTAFTSAMVTVTGGTLTGFTGSGTAYTATFVPQAAFTGAATIRVAAGAFTDTTGNANIASPVASLAVDTIPPNVVVAVGTASLGTGQTTPVTFTLDKPSTTFTAASVAVTGGMLTGFAGSSTAYTATFVPWKNYYGTATLRIDGGAFTDASGNANVAGTMLPLNVDTRPLGVLAAGTDGSSQTWSREFAYTAAGPTSIRVAGLSATQAGFFSRRMRLTITPADAPESVGAIVVKRAYDAGSRSVTVTLDRAIPITPQAGTLVLGEAVAPGARLVDASTGAVLREIGGQELVAAGYSTAFVTRFQGGLRVAAGDVDGDALPDLAVAPGGVPAQRAGADFGRSSRLVTIFSGTTSPTWTAASVDVSAVFAAGAPDGYFVALGDVVADASGSGTRELVVAAGRRVAIFDVLVAAGTPTIVANPARVIDLAAAGSVTGVSIGGLFDPAGRSDIVVATTTGTQRVAGTTTVTILSGGTLDVIRSFGISSLVESGPARRLVNVFGRGASPAVGDVDGDGRNDLVLGAGAMGLGNFRVLGNEFVTAATARTDPVAFAAAIDAELGGRGRFGHSRPTGPKWKPNGGPDFFTPGDAVGPTGSGFNAPLAIATVSGNSATNAKAWVFAALGANNQTGNSVRRLLYAGANRWTLDANFSQLPSSQSTATNTRFRSGTGLRIG